MTRSCKRAAKLCRTTAILAATAVVGAVAVPAVASANTAWVSPAPVKSPFNACATPGFNSIQQAINVASTTTIHVCPGTYGEQITIPRALKIVAPAGANVTLPASPVNSATSCDGPEQQDLITVCGSGVVETVSISGLTIEGRWPAGPECGKNFYDVFVGGTANLLLSKSSILHAGAEPINGCQQGVGVRVGRGLTGQVGTAKLTSDTITGYQKGGVVVDGPGSKATISKTKVTGTPTPELAQNAIQVSRGAAGAIVESEVTGNECNHPTCGSSSLAQEEEDAAGVLFFEEAKGSVAKSTISGNDIGIYHQGKCCTSTVQAKITGNTLTEDRFWGVVLDQGVATVSKNTIAGNATANVGIQLLQYAGQEFGAKGTGTEDEITGMTKCAVEGFTDNGGSDQFGSLTLTQSLSKFSGNTTNVCNNATNGKLTISVS